MFFSDSLTTSVHATQLTTALPAGADAVVAVRVPEDEWFTSCPSTPESLTADAVIVQPSIQAPGSRPSKPGRRTRHVVSPWRNPQFHNAEPKKV